MIIAYHKSRTLLIDLHPSCPSTAQPSLNRVRYTFAAKDLASLQPLIDTVDIGRSFTIITPFQGEVAAICSVTVKSWRRQKLDSDSEIDADPN